MMENEQKQPERRHEMDKNTQELLEALTLILNLNDHDVWTDESWQVALDKARTAITKATGGNPVTNIVTTGGDTELEVPVARIVTVPQDALIRALDNLARAYRTLGGLEVAFDSELLVAEALLSKIGINNSKGE